VTIDELRAFCLALPGAHEKETWGDEEHAGDVTFRVNDRIFVITGPNGGSASIRTTTDQQAELLDTFPGTFRSAPYVGRFGWVVVDLDAVDDALLRGIIEGAWRRTAPKAVVRAYDEVHA
jgi:predicted DNA-binding protein (MmcQ/YjbR family)